MLTRIESEGHGRYDGRWHVVEIHDPERPNGRRRLDDPDAREWHVASRYTGTESVFFRLEQARRLAARIELAVGLLAALQLLGGEA